jgi:putative phosphonate metabolism protein
VTFTRYAIYYAPPSDTEWARFGTSWLGWDMERGCAVPHPAIDARDIAPLTEVPRKYGLHATMKPPMRLADGCSADDLAQAVADLAASQPPVTLEGLEIAQLGRFLALRPLGDEAALNGLAAACVTGLDRFRAPAPQAELDRRRAAGLSEAQERNLVQWGYPHVLDGFRFHITLTGKLPKPALPNVRDVLNTYLAPLLPAPFMIRDLALVGEAENGRFHMIHRYALTG